MSIKGKDKLKCWRKKEKEISKGNNNMKKDN